jgi:hypothetical protein
MWGVHFLRRFVEILFIHDYRGHFHTLEAIGTNVFHPLFGFWIGWSCNYFAYYWMPNSYILIPGVLIFILGESGNCACHVMLKRMRTNQPAGDTNHAANTGCLFRYTSVPHHWFELVTWLGFAIATFTAASFIFLALNITIVIIYATWKKYLCIK